MVIGHKFVLHNCVCVSQIKTLLEHHEKSRSHHEQVKSGGIQQKPQNILHYRLKPIDIIHTAHPCCVNIVITFILVQVSDNIE